MLQTTPKQLPKIKRNLDDTYSYLAGNAFGRDKKGRVKKDDISDLHGGGESAEYTAFVYYEFDFE